MAKDNCTLANKITEAGDYITEKGFSAIEVP